MVKGILFFFVLWIVVSGLISIFSNIDNDEKMSVIKCVLYGFLTAGIAAIVVGVMVLVF